jgi:hypothetical protein
MRRRRREEFLQLVQRNAVMAPRRLDGLNAPGEDPMLEGRVADADSFCRLARRKERSRRHRIAQFPPDEYFTLQAAGCVQSKKCEKAHLDPYDLVKVITRQRCFPDDSLPVAAFRSSAGSFRDLSTFGFKTLNQEDL